MKRKRKLQRILTAAFDKRHYVSLLSILRLCDDRISFLKRYLFGGGEYPYRPPVRTPCGLVRPFCKLRDDVLTVNEVFFRDDYGVPEKFRTVVDIGGNIGLSVLFFLTRNPDSFVCVFEPNPANHDGLRENLKGYESRYRLDDAAVWTSNGTVRFGVEPTGRYGRVEGERDEYITVRTVAIGDALRAIISERGEIDVLKIDTEGSEEELVAAIPEELLPKIKLILCETRPTGRIWPKFYAQEQYGAVCRLDRLPA